VAAERVSKYNSWGGRAAVDRNRNSAGLLIVSFVGGRLRRPFPAATADGAGVSLPIHAGPFLPRNAPPFRAHLRTAIRKFHRISFFVECPRFRERSGRDGKNPSRVSAALR
jgi:hypothetical protein